jgi:O-antigen ligase
LCRWVCHALLAGGMVAAVLFAGGTTLCAMGLPVALLAMALVAAGTGRALERQAAPVEWKAAVALALVCGYFVWRMATSPVQDLARYDFLLLAGACCLWVTLRFAPPVWRLERSLWLVMGIAVAGNAGIAAYQFWGDPAFTPIHAGRPQTGFGSGFYARYNDLGPFLAAALMPLLALIGWPGIRWWVRVAAGMLAAVALAGLVAAQARSGLIALGAGTSLLVMLWLVLPASAGGKRGMILLVSLPILLFGGWKLTTAMLANRGSAEEGSSLLQYNERLFYAGMAIEQIVERPVLGSGSQSYSYIHPRFWPQRGWGASRNPRWAHNEFLQVTADYGLLGLLLLLGGLGWLWLRGAVAAISCNTREKATSQALRAGAVCAMVALAAAALFSFIFHLLPTLLVLAFLAAVCVPKGGKPPHRGGKLALAAAMGIIGLGVFPAAAREAHAWWASRALWQPSSLQARQAALEDSLRISPSFDRHVDLGVIHVAAGERAADPHARQKFLQLAEHEFAAAQQRHPFELEIIHNRANLLDSLGRFAEANPLHAQVVAVGDPREIWWRGRFYRGRHYDLWARSLWAQRRPEEALWLLHRAREEFSRAEKLAPFPPASALAAVVAQNAATITLLETARVLPLRPAFLAGD